VTWAINGTFSGAEQGVSFNITTTSPGSFTVTDTRVTGNSVSDFGGTVSSGARPSTSASPPRPSSI